MGQWASWQVACSWAPQGQHSIPARLPDFLRRENQFQRITCPAGPSLPVGATSGATKVHAATVLQLGLLSGALYVVNPDGRGPRPVRQGTCVQQSRCLRRAQQASWQHWGLFSHTRPLPCCPLTESAVGILNKGPCHLGGRKLPHLAAGHCRRNVWKVRVAHLQPVWAGLSCTACQLGTDACGWAVEVNMPCKGPGAALTKPLA